MYEIEFSLPDPSGGLIEFYEENKSNICMREPGVQVPYTIPDFAVSTVIKGSNVCKLCLTLTHIFEVLNPDLSPANITPLVSPKKTEYERKIMK